MCIDTIRYTIARDLDLPDIHKRSLLDKLTPGFLGITQSQVDLVWKEYTALRLAFRNPTS